MDWNCPQIEERLSDFLEGALSPEETAAFTAHTAGCAGCAKLVTQVGGLVSRVQQAPQVDTPPQLTRQILDATLGPRKHKPASQGLFGWLQLIWQPRFAMGIVTVAASLAIVFHAVASQEARASLNPANLLRGANRQVHLTYAHGAKFVNNLRVVYEIESMLSSQPESMSEPVTPPPARPSIESQPGQQPPPNDPHEKSQTIPRSTRRGLRNGPELAYMDLQPGAIEGSLYATPRSVL